MSPKRGYYRRVDGVLELKLSGWFAFTRPTLLIHLTLSYLIFSLPSFFPGRRNVRTSDHHDCQALHRPTYELPTIETGCFFMVSRHVVIVEGFKLREIGSRRVRHSSQVLNPSGRHAGSRLQHGRRLSEATRQSRQSLPGPEISDTAYVPPVLSSLAHKRSKVDFRTSCMHSPRTGGKHDLEPIVIGMDEYRKSPWEK